MIEHLLALAPSDRHRPVHVVANDTLVESPLVIAHIRLVQDEIRKASAAFSLPLTVVTTQPDPNNTFWVNLVGRGYPSPNRSFRWCTDRMKIQPTSQYIRKQVGQTGEVILLLGVRRSESAARAGSIARHDTGRRLNRHNDLLGCWVFRPIVNLSTEQVWRFLGGEYPPWGGTHDRLIKLYRAASGGDCPVVTTKADAPSCGTNSSRFGCWTCTVVEKDRSLAGFVESGFGEFTPLLDFRDWLVSIRNDPARRLARRRGGRVTFSANGTHVPGPFTLATRAEILAKLLDVQSTVGRSLISTAEMDAIRMLWAEDAIVSAMRTSPSLRNDALLEKEETCRVMW